MDELEGHFPWRLGVAVVLSLAAHVLVLLLVWPAVGLGSPAADPANDSASKPERRDDPELGQTEPSESQVAWISHEAFQELMAEQARTRQPAVQQKAEPAEQAPMELDPTPPVPPPQPRQTAQQPTRQPAETPALAQAQQPRRGLPNPPTANGQIPFQPEPVTAPGKAREKTPDASAGQTGRQQEVSPQPQTPPQPQRQPKPTAVPKAQKEALPSDIRVNPKTFRFGQVLARDGLTIQTAVPRFSAVAQVSSIGASLPTARLTFDPKGQVIEAKMLSSTGYENIDGPILASLYKWEATGPKLDSRQQPFNITIHFTRSEGDG
jgi:outer membrane biosynthesis protein TonB